MIQHVQEVPCRDATREPTPAFASRGKANPCPSSAGLGEGPALFLEDDGHPSDAGRGVALGVVLGVLFWFCVWRLFFG